METCLSPVKHRYINDPNLQFDALSYIWGEPVVENRIFIDGHFMKATSSLLAAVQRLKTRSKYTSLWAGAICIDQANNE